MKKETSKNQSKLLTEVELELMNILWRLKEGSVNDVLAQLPTDRDLAYTSVSTILRILEQKQILKTRKEGRGHIYIPLLQKSEYESKTLRHVIDKVFDGTAIALVKQLVDTVKIDQKEINELKELVKRLEMKK